MEITQQQHGAVLMLGVQAARIDAAVAIEFKDQMRALLAEYTGRVALDISQVAFIDSSGLGALVAAKKLMTDRGALELVGLSPGVWEVFRLTRMDSVFTIHDTVDAVSATAAE